MAKRPLLILPAPAEPSKRRKKAGGGGQIHLPGRKRQAERLAPRFKLLEDALAERGARLESEARGLVPEEVIVLETVKPIQDFIRAVEKIPGMQWLGEIEEEDIPPNEDFFALDPKGTPQLAKPLRGRLFLVFSNQKALKELLSLWRRWQSDRNFPHGLTKWRYLFEHLRDVRRWGVRDRLIETQVLDDWRERIASGHEVVPCEIELWYRNTPQQRRRAGRRVAEIVVAQKGEILDEAVIEDICYHALLVRIPIAAIHTLLEQNYDTELVQCEQVHFFRAAGQMASVLLDDERQEDRFFEEETVSTRSPIVALLDGLPLQAHQRLAGRLIVDDPDDLAESYPAENRRHGTAMASLILHGDLGSDDEPLSRPLYVRPILRPDSRNWNRVGQEVVSEDKLVLDLLYRAVRRLFEGEGDEPPVAPEVAVINLSIGIRDRPFDGSLSPLARLVDWLAWRYQILFVVSSGNHTQRIELDISSSELSALTPEDLQSLVLRAVAADNRHRRLLSPAEAVNALTVSALHQDFSTVAPPPQWKNPYPAQGLPSPINSQGMGYRRAIKPDVLAQGGMIVVQEYLGSTDQATLNIYDRTLAPGQLVAAPGHAAGVTNATWFTRGTSNATALVSRGAAQLHDTLEELQKDPGGELLEAIPRSIWLKVLIAHGADWSSGGTVVQRILKTDDNSRQFREYITRLLGYGSIDVERIRQCTEQRVTAISGGFLTKDHKHLHRFPLPPSLSGQRGHRKLTITLAWLTPVNPRHQSWRRADLWFAPPKDPLRVKRHQADWRAVQRGTLQHEVLQGEEASVFVDGDNLEIEVSCRSDAGALEDEVPYAIATSLEVAEEIGISIYDEIRTRVHAKVLVAPSA